MPYLPTICEPFAAPGVLPGWICCSCGHYNGRKQDVCYHCGHTSCASKRLETASVDYRIEAKKNHDAVVSPVLKKRSRAPRYLTKKQIAARQEAIVKAKARARNMLR